MAYIPLPSERVKYGLRSVISNVSENERFLNRKRLSSNITNTTEIKQNDTNKITEKEKNSSKISY